MNQRDMNRITKLEAEIERLQGKINDAKRKIAIIKNKNHEPTDHLDKTGCIIYTGDVVKYMHEDCLGRVTEKTGRVERNLCTNCGSLSEFLIRFNDNTINALGLILNRDLEILF